MRRLKIFYNKQEIERKQNLRNKWVTVKTEIGQSIILEEKVNKESNEKRIPHPIAFNKNFALWKFFIRYVDGKIVYLKEPRYMLRKANEWFKIKEIKIVNE